MLGSSATLPTSRKFKDAEAPRPSPPREILANIMWVEGTLKRGKKKGEACERKGRKGRSGKIEVKMVK